jgi:hypothetical protein
VLQQKTQRELFSTERRKEKRRKERKSRMKIRGKKKNRGYILGGEIFFLIGYKTETKCKVAFHL